MKIVRLKIKTAKIPAFICLVLGLAFPAHGKVGETVEALANPYGKVEAGVDTLVNFKGPNGAQPQSITEDPSGNFYGTTRNGGKYNQGIVFEILQSGKLVTLINFNGRNGANPEAALLLGPDGSLYGTTKSGGADNKGTVFKIAPDGKFSTLASFNGKNGAQPDSGLLMRPDGSIYGTTLAGGAASDGTVFKISPAGQLTTETTFNGANGASPGSLVWGDDGNIYGTANKGGRAGKGLLFKFKPDPELTTLVTFDGANGAFPVSGLIKSADGNFYGTTKDGGKDNLGTVFELTSDGKLITLISFDGVNGSHPDTGLVEWNNGYFYMTHLWQNVLFKSAAVQWSGDNFCGTTSGGGARGDGTVFRVGDDGTLFTLVSFTGSEGVDLGAVPNSLIPGRDGNLYGTTLIGGTDGQGTVWRVNLQQWPLPVAGAAGTTEAGGIMPIVSP